MKKLLFPLCLLFLLCGCQKEPEELTRAMALRETILKSEGCGFTCHITADDGDAIHKFSVSCRGDSQGNISFTVIKPENIEGITGTIQDDGGRLTYTDTALHFSLLRDGQLSPVSAPWIFLRTLREGYLMNAGKEGEQIHVGIRDSYEENALQGDLWLGAGDLPEKAEFLYGNRKILTLQIEDFHLIEQPQV